jgi:Xaa-Pro aminopeptidase
MTCFQKRREALAALLDRKDGVFLLAASTAKQRNGDVYYPYRPDSYFYYLTGFAEAEAICLIKKSAGKVYSVLFCQAPDPEHSRWHGPVLGPDTAKKQLHFDAAYPIGEFKDATEIAIMKEAAAVSVEAHLAAMAHTKPGISESAVEGAFLAACHQRGCRQVAYESIVAAGDNACVLHYTRNQATLRSGDLLLVDAGAECEYYASDITRTYPINGVFSAEQRALYEVVLDAQQAAIEAAKIGTPWKTLQTISELEITKGLVRLGILSGNAKCLQAYGEHKRFYMHGVGHWLGLDVHDVGKYTTRSGASRIIEPGMVFTVEPGIYIDRGHTDVPQKWHGIGIRIEDDVHISNQGAEVLTRALPRQPADIEALIGSHYG